MKIRYPTLVKKADYDANIEAESFTKPDYIKFTDEILDNKAKEKGLVDQPDISAFIENSDLDKKIATLAKKAELKAKHHKIVILQASKT